MLSTQNPPSAPLKINDNNKHQFEVDLFKSALHLDNNKNPLPNFSIRDYVLNTRGNKDIKTHWPFSQKNLQLCLKHGVKDVLPPFQALDSVRNLSIEKLSGLSDHHFSLSSNNVVRKLAPDTDNFKSTSSEKDRECPSTTTSLSCSDVNSTPLIKSQYLRGSLVGRPEFAILASYKAHIVKLSNVVGPKSHDTCVVPETMSSKVCPVCKTFTSASNTTLNAHIDQCLSGESTLQQTANSKVIKLRIKPRRTRMMVDIYATALHYTMEDLDRRNGTNWASKAQHLGVLDEEKNTNSSVDIEDDDDKVAVHFGSNGSKLHILSTFNDLQSSSNTNYDCGPRTDKKGNKLVSRKKNKYLVQRHKLLKCPRQQTSCSLRPNHCLEVNNRQVDEKEHLAKHLKIKCNDYGMIKQWVGSKGRGLKKKMNNLPIPMQGDVSSHKRKEKVSFNCHDDIYMRKKNLKQLTDDGHPGNHASWSRSNKKMSSITDSDISFVSSHHHTLPSGDENASNLLIVSGSDDEAQTANHNLVDKEILGGESAVTHLELDIPIPSPPGWFLPSQDHNSSLTSYCYRSRIHSSEDDEFDTDSEPHVLRLMGKNLMVLQNPHYNQHNFIPPHDLNFTCFL